MKFEEILMAAIPVIIGVLVADYLIQNTSLGTTLGIS